MGWFSNSCERCGTKIKKSRDICGSCEVAIREEARAAEATRAETWRTIGKVAAAVGGVIALVLKGGGGGN
jgi:hypothetical protein